MLSRLRVPRWNDVLLAIHQTPEKHRYTQKIITKTKASSTQVGEIIKQLEKYNLIEINPGLKIKKINLTEKGKKIALAVMSIKLEL